jgi:hypothetical protein
MICDKASLSQFFSDLCLLGTINIGKPGYGYGCKNLMEDLITRPGLFPAKIIENYDGDFHEYRLNGAGLKMHWRVVREERQPPQFQCYISGDQVRDYPAFVHHAQKLIKQWQANHR